jgi:multidrug efflux system membrane fusion protein
MPRRLRPLRTAFLSAPLLACATALLLAGCEKKAPPRNVRVPVTVAKAERRPMPYSILASGTVEPIQTANVGSQVGGVVMRIAFREGEDVRAGQALLELDPRPFRAALAQAQGTLARDRAQLRTAQLAADRAASLFRQDLVSQAEWDNARSAADALRGTVEADSAAATGARLNLEYATIRSPISGRTGKLNVHVGDYIKAASSEPLVTVNQVSPIWVQFTVAEDDRPAVQRYQATNPRVLVRPQGEDSLEVAGRLVFVDNAVDPTTGTLVLKAEFPNRDGQLWPGEFVEVRLVLAVQKNALVVPSPAVSNGQQGTYVYVLNADSSATVRPVTVERSDDVSAVISKGLEPGETVVTDGQFRISPGARLVVRETGRKARP